MASLRELLQKQRKGELGFWEEAELNEKLGRVGKKRAVLKAHKEHRLKSPDISTFARTINNSTYTSSFDRKSCVHFDKPSNFCKGGTKKHNLREYTAEQEPDHLLPKEHRIEFNKERDSWELTDEKTGAPINPKTLFNAEYKKYKGAGKRPKYENSVWEAIIVLNESHELDDLMKVKDYIEKAMNITCYRVAIHRDEGHIDEKGKVHINYHAHLDFVTLKDRKQNFQRGYTKQILPMVQTEVAKILKMQRGKVGSNAKHYEPKEYRKFIKQENKRQQLLKQMKDKDKRTAQEIAELKDKLQKAETLKFNKTIAYAYLKKQFDYYNDKFDKLGEPYNSKDHPLRKAFFAEITRYTKEIDPKEIDFLAFRQHLSVIESKYEKFLINEINDFKRLYNNSYQLSKERNAEITRLKGELAEKEKDLNAANAQITALNEKIKDAPEAQPTKAAEPKIAAAIEIPPQNENNAPKIENNVKTQEIPQEREKVENSREKSEIEVLIDKQNAEMQKFGVLDQNSRAKKLKELQARNLQIIEKANEIVVNVNDNSQELKFRANGCINKFRDFEKEISQKYGLSR